MQKELAPKNESKSEFLNLSSDFCGFYSFHPSDTESVLVRHSCA